MAFDLTAVLRLRDQFSEPLRRANRQLQSFSRMSQETTRTIGESTRTQSRLTAEITNTGRATLELRSSLRASSSQMQRASQDAQNLNTHHSRLRRVMQDVGETSVRAFGMMGRGAGEALRGVTSIKAGFLGIVAAIGGAKAAYDIFQKTIGEAARFEQSNVMIHAMFNNDKAADQYTKMIQQMALKSPVFNSQDMFANSKSFISLTKSNAQLEKMWDLAERLTATDPAQGVEGAVLALKELFSGDATSLVERFELSRKTLNDIKNLSLDKQLTALDKYFTKMGITKNLINQMGGTTIGLWQQIQESVALTLRNMGAPALQVIKNFLGELNNGLQGGNLSQFQKTGADILKNIASGFVDAAKGIGNWIQSIQNSEEFQRKTTLFGKVEFIFSDIWKLFQKWLDAGGSKQISDLVAKVVQIVSAGLQSSIEYIVPIAKTLGMAIASGIEEGCTQALKDSWLIQAINNPKQFAQKKAVEVVAKFAWNYSQKTSSSVPKSAGGVDSQGTVTGAYMAAHSHAGGLSRVPYDGYLARLHKDERVLTAGENASYGKGGNVFQFGDIILNGVGGNLEKAADRLLDIMATKIQLAGGAGA
jgi:hypothetical protein